MINIGVPHPDHDWQPVSRVMLIGWCVVYALAMYSYWPHGPHIFDNAHLIPHEAGHLLFSYTGSEWITVAAGSFMQLFVPVALAASFAWRGHTLGTAFCGWAFFHSLVNLSVYMADARARALPLVAPGIASDEIETHDWNYLFTSMGLLQQDTAIAKVVAFIGWIGMLATIGWLVYRWRLSEREDRAQAATA
jgi:hypothetical protein